MRLKKRTYPLIFSALGIAGTLSLAFSLTLKVVLIGIALLAVGMSYWLIKKGVSKKLLLEPEGERPPSGEDA